MWEAFFAFHISIAHCDAELTRSSVFKRAMRSLAIVFVAPLLEYLTNMAESSKPGCVQALIAESAMEALHVTVLHWAARLE